MITRLQVQIFPVDGLFFFFYPLRMVLKSMSLKEMLHEWFYLESGCLFVQLMVKQALN